ncbi:MAG TPA: glycoside hydrolase family 3 C-terminal domain-containing protein [Caulobacteraceae bacterium]|nr:glycoside hydrolase family 3 C-terminal domain-containing protein [Caulobacteraceae bacterium]
MTDAAVALGNEPFRDPTAPLEARVDDLAGRLTLEEKVALMAGSAPFTLTGAARLGVPEVRVCDGPTGVRSNEGEAATVFPVGVAQAASWNPRLVEEVAAAIAREALALDNRVVLAPTINIVRTPLWGRAFETYSEDPYLAGVLGTAFVNGLQGEGVGASLKHYAANNQEEGRMTVSVEADERTMREIYLAAFEKVVKEAGPWTVMASYNRLRGHYATESAYLLRDILEGEWGFDGVVVSDWGAVHSTGPAVAGGCGLEMPGPARWFGDKLLAAVKAGEVAQADIDEAARRMVRLILRTGVLDSAPKPVGELRSKRHRAIAARAAEEAIVLLKNKGALLPLAAGELRSIAVLGSNATARRIQGGGSSQVRPGRQVSILASITEFLAGRCEVLHAEGGDNEPHPPAARSAFFSPDEARGQAGLLVEYFEARGFGGAPFRSGPERGIGKLVSAAAVAGLGRGVGALRWTGFLWPQRDGRHELSLRAPGEGRLTLEGKTLIDPAAPASFDKTDVGGLPIPRRTAAVELIAGRGYPITIEYRRPENAEALPWEYVGVGLRQPCGSIGEAAALAARADAAVVVVGAASTTEGEGYDRADLELPGDQNALVDAVLAVNPKTVVVVVGGAPYRLPWADHVSAILCPWFGGEEGPDALARVIFGRAEPSGRLPVSWPRRIEETAAWGAYPGGESVNYAEGLFVGYRHFDRAPAAPLFPFGFGLTYARFAWSGLEAPEEARPGEAVWVGFTLRNVGERAGAEVAQLYVRPRAPSVPRPVKELKAFAKVSLAPGESRRVRLRLDDRAFSFWDPEVNAWVAEPGWYDLLIGCSAADIELQTTVHLAE